MKAPAKLTQLSLETNKNFFHYISTREKFYKNILKAHIHN